MPPVRHEGVQQASHRTPPLQDTVVPNGALFVAADEPMLIYQSVADAERDLEAIDVENGVYPAAFGPNGQPYAITTDGTGVLIVPTGEPEDPDALKSLLTRYLDAIGEPAAPEEDVHALVRRAWLDHEAFWAEHDPYGDRFGSRIPLWGCLALIAVAGAIAYAVIG